MTSAEPHVYLLYQFLHPDEVVSSLHFTQLGLGLRESGWRVTAFPSNRDSHHPDRRYAASEEWSGIEFRRIWRPALKQASGVGRLMNAVWMLAAWSLLALTRRAPDMVIIGTDPILSLLAAYPWRWLRPRTRIVHWCFDMYPEAAAADGLINGKSPAYRLLMWLMQGAYRRSDLIVDIGACMREKLREHAPGAAFETLVPWALAEPPAALPHPDGSNDRPLAVLYSGNLGRAHHFGSLLALARELRGEPVRLVFSVRGFRAPQLERELRPEDRNIERLPLAPAGKLSSHLAAADVHAVSLIPEWNGLVVPSKFFGALAIGRPVLFTGDRGSAIARWIEEHGVGWVLSETPSSSELQDLSARLLRFSRDANERSRLNQHCHAIYQRHFSRAASIARWRERLEGLLAKERLTNQPESWNRPGSPTCTHSSS